MCSPQGRSLSRRGSTPPTKQKEFRAKEKTDVISTHLPVADPLVQDFINNKLFTIISHDSGILKLAEHKERSEFITDYNYCVIHITTSALQIGLTRNQESIHTVITLGSQWCLPCQALITEMVPTSTTFYSSSSPFNHRWAIMARLLRPAGTPSTCIYKNLSSLTLAQQCIFPPVC